MPSIFQNCLPPESPTPAVRIVILLDNYEALESEDHLFSHPAAFDGGREGLRFPRNGPDFSNNDLFTSDPDSDEELPAEQIPTDMLA